MSEYIYEHKPSGSDHMGKPVELPTLVQREEIVRCGDCEHATISTLGFCKYCEMWALPDVDGYGCDSQVNLPLDFFCAYGKRKEGGE